MFKQLYRLQRYTFLHELPNVFNTFLHNFNMHTFFTQLSHVLDFLHNFPRITFMTTAFPSYSLLLIASTYSHSFL